MFWFRAYTSLRRQMANNRAFEKRRIARSVGWMPVDRLINRFFRTNGRVNLWTSPSKSAIHLRKNLVYPTMTLDHPLYESVPSGKRPRLPSTESSEGRDSSSQEPLLSNSGPCLSASERPSSSNTSVDEPENIRSIWVDSFCVEKLELHDVIKVLLSAPNLTDEAMKYFENAKTKSSIKHCQSPLSSLLAFDFCQEVRIVITSQTQHARSLVNYLSLTWLQNCFWKITRTTSITIGRVGWKGHFSGVPESFVHNQISRQFIKKQGSFKSFVDKGHKMGKFCRKPGVGIILDFLSAANECLYAVKERSMQK